MPCGHSDAEFAQFSKTERRILRMVVELQMDRAAILAALEIVDSTFRMHIANIRRKQAVMRVTRAQEATRLQDERLAAKFLPERKEETVEEKKVPVPTLRPFRAGKAHVVVNVVKEPPPLETVHTLAPKIRRGTESFVELPPSIRKQENGVKKFGEF